MKARTLTTRPSGQDLRRASKRWERVRRAASELTPEAIEQIAHRVAELIRPDRHDQAPANDAPTLLNASQLARQLGVTRTWVYEHANELGAIPLGDGARPRLRFAPEIAAQVFRSRRHRHETARAAQGHEGGRPGRPRQRQPSQVPLLPIRNPTARGILSRFVLPRRSRH